MKRRLFTITLCLLGIITLSLAVLTTTPWGLRLTLNGLQYATNHRFQYGSADGVLLGSIQLKQVSFNGQHQLLSIDALSVSWHPMGLIHRRIDIDKLFIETAKITLHQQAQHTQAKPNQEKMYLSIGNGHIQDLYIGNTANQYPVHIHHAEIEGMVKTNRVAIQLHAHIASPTRLSTHIRLEGSPQHYQIDVQLHHRQMSWHILGTGNSDGLTLRLPTTTTLGGQLGFQFTTTWFPSPMWQLHLHGRELNGKLLSPHWPRITAANADLTNHGPGQHLKGQLTLATALNHIHITATDHPTEQVAWQIEANDLSELSQQLHGRLKTSGQWAIQPSRRTSGTITAQKLQLNDWHLGQLSGRWHIADNARNSTLHVVAHQLGLKHTVINQITAQATGNAAQHTLQLTAQNNTQQGSATITGHLTGTHWTGKLTHLEQTEGLRHRHWQLLNPVSLHISSEDIRAAQPLCVRTTKGQKSLCITGSWHRYQPWSAHLTGQRILPDVLTTWLNWPDIWYAPISFTADLQGEGYTVHSAAFTGHIQPGYIQIEHPAPFKLNIDAGQLTATWNKQSLSLKTHWILSDTNTLDLTLSRQQDNQNNAAQWQGQLSVAIAELAKLPNLKGLAEQPSGQLSAQLQFSGTPKAPHLDGKLTLSHGQISLPKLGITARDVNANARFVNQRATFALNAKTKTGDITLKGTSSRHQDTYTTSATLTGQGLKVVSGSVFELYASPQLNLHMVNQHLHVTGNIDVPKGNILIKSHPAIHRLPTEDIIYSDGGPITSTPLWQWSSQVQINLGPEVRLQAFGLNAQIKGSAQMQKSFDTTPRFTGRVSVLQGTYDNLGRHLIVTPGSHADYLDTVIGRPSLNLRATKTIQTIDHAHQTGNQHIVVGVKVQGPLKDPKITYFSEPAALSQSDILSYLLLGYASDDVQSPTNSSAAQDNRNLNLLLTAASLVEGPSIGIGNMINRLKQGFGLMELGVESDTLTNALGSPINQQTAFVVSKQLSKALYLRYSFDLRPSPLSAPNALQMQYAFNPDWSIQVIHSSLGDGGDLLYTLRSH